MNLSLPIDIGPYASERAIEIADLVHAAVHAIDSAIYSIAQKEAWAPTPPDYQKWASRLEIKQPYLATLNDRLIGFMEFDLSGYIDCLYVDPEYQGQGVAMALYNHILAIAQQKSVPRLSVDASHVARPLFERLGFSVVRENRVVRDQITLTNFKMQKWLHRN